MTPPCPLGIKDIQPAGVGTKGAAPRRHRSPREPPLLLGLQGWGVGKGVLGSEPHFPTFLLDILHTLDAARGAVKPRRL